MFSSITSYLFGSSEEEPTNQETVKAPEAVESTNQETGLPGSTNQEEERLHTKPAEDEWVLVEKSRTASKMESSSMENLLIEHPSMSVYSHRGRQGSAGADSDNSESSTDEVLIQSRSSRAGLARHEPPRRPNALAARVGLNQVQGIKSMQRAQQRHMYRNLSKSHIVRSNKVNQINGRKRRNTQLHVQQPQKRCISIKQC